MGQQFQSYRSHGSWRGGRGERLWLSTLVDTMEEVASRRDKPCDREVLAALRAQLALPAASRFVRPVNFLN